MLSVSTMTLVDTLFVSRLGASALAGVGLGGILIWVLMCFPLGLVRGAKILVSQAVGAGQEDDIGRILGTALSCAVALGLATLVLGQVAAHLLPALSASAAAGDAAESYFRVRVLGTPLVGCFWALREVRQAQGEAQTPMVASITANIANVALDYVLIFGLDLGVAGAAWASVAAGALEFVVLAALVSRDASPFGRAFGWRHVRALWWVGWPSGLEMLIEMGAFTVLSVMVSRYHETHMAAHQIALQVIHFAFLPAFAVGEATSVWWAKPWARAASTWCVRWAAWR